MKWETGSLAEFEQAVKNIFETIILPAGTTVVVGLVGNLGAGKTAFSKIIAKILGVSSEITSPTFTIMKAYETTNENFKELVHIDAYRIDELLEVQKLKINNYFEKPNTLTLIEWPENIRGALPQNTIYIEIAYDSGDPEKRHLALL